jgi:2-polyprenyl-3-methyl-5-hydroxy-6-metoxy-1,4-benzoquinol methylase
MNKVQQFYQSYNEDSRLVKDDCHRVEFITTLYFLDDYLRPELKIIDVGAGTGRYAFYLAQQNCCVTALDVVPKYVDLMQVKAKEQSLNVDIRQSDARDLAQFGNAQFDMVLCMGPLYHLKTKKDRNQALNACLRILKPGGIIAAAYVNRYASHLWEVLKNDEPLDTKFLHRIIAKGIQAGEKSDSFYFSFPAEIEQMMSDSGVSKEKNIGSDGITYLLNTKNAKLHESEFKYWLEYHLATCENQSLLGYSLHALYIGRKQLL